MEAAKIVGISLPLLRHWAVKYREFAPTYQGLNKRLRYPRETVVTLCVVKHLLRVELYSVAGIKRQLRLARERMAECG